MQCFPIRVAFTVWFCVGLGSAAAAGAPPDYFEAHVKPLLVDRCLACHGSDRKGGLDLRQPNTALAGGDSGPVIESGDPGSSSLMDYVESQEMPPGQPLSSDEVAILRKWISDGAYFPPQPIDPFAVTTSKRAGLDWWSLRSLSEPIPPAVDAPLREWSDHPIDRFIAAQMAMKGLRPSPPADRRSLIRRVSYDLTGLAPTYEEVQAFVDDSRPDAYEQLVDRLLASPHYGEQWGRHWLDVVRFGESNGFERNQIIDNAWPFRDYVIRSLNEDKPFNQLVREHLAGDQLASGDPTVEVGTTFLVCGPYDDVGNQDPVQAAQIRANTVDDMIRAVGETFLGLTVGCARCHDHKFDPVTQRDYYAWYATLAGVHHGSRPLADLPTLPNCWVGEFRAAPGPFHIFIGGSPERPGEEVAASSLGALAPTLDGYQLPADASEAVRRQALAEWLVRSDNPLTPRVLANRIWHYHFGTGIVDTPSDFGFMGGRPTHPELLDWLACQLRANGWRLKPLHRLIVLSRVYQQASTWNAESAQVDAASRYLWRFPPRRLTAEEFRDTLLQTSGKLDLRMGGPGFRLYRYEQDNVATYVPLDQFGPETYRRSVYHQNARAMRIDLMTDFDGPDCAFAAPRRDTTTTPLQALTLLNHQFTLDMSDALAERVAAEVRGDQAPETSRPPQPTASVERAFEIVFARRPVDAERTAGVNLVQAHGLPAFCRALLNANELLYCD